MKKRLLLHSGIIAFIIMALAGCDDGTTSGGSVNQTPTAADFNIGNLTQTAGSVTPVTVTPKSGKSPGTVTVWYTGTGSTTYAKSTTVPQTAGTYAVTLDVAAASGWNTVSGLYAGTLTINGQTQTPTTADFNIGNLTQTAGSVTAVTITPKSGKSTGTVTIYYEGTGGTIYAKNTSVPTAAGTYAVTFNVAAATGWNAASGLSAGTLTINAAIPGNQTPVADDYTIGNLTQTAGSVTAVTITPKSGKSTGTVTVYYEGTDTTTYAKSSTLPQTAGTYTVTFNVAAASGWYAVSGLSAGTLTINAAIPGNQTPVADDYTIGNLTQTAGSVTAVTIIPKSGKSAGTVTIYYEGTDTTTYAKSSTLPQTAGTYTVTFNVAAASGWNAANGLSAGTLTINKAAGASVGAPTLNTKTHNSITINTVTASNGQPVEYAKNTSDTAPLSGWQTSTIFNDLYAETLYYIFARAAENNNYNAGTASNSLSVTTMATVSEDRFEYYWVDQHDSLVTTSGGSITTTVGATLIITAQGTGYVVKHWYLDGVNTGQNENAYTFSSRTIGKHTVSLFVEKDDKLYNTNITITVANGSETNPFPLTTGVWENGNISNASAVWYSFSVTSGTTYRVWWNDSDQGNSTKTLDVKVSATYSNGATIFTDIDRGYTTAQFFTANQTGTVKIKVVPYSSGRTGTFAVVYSTGSTRP